MTEVDQMKQEEPTARYRWTGWVWKITGSSSRPEENYGLFSRNLENIPQISEEKLKDVNEWPVGLGNTAISTDYAQKSPQTLNFDQVVVEAFPKHLNLLHEHVHYINELLSIDKAGYKSSQSWLHLVVFWYIRLGKQSPDLKTKILIALFHGWIHQISPKEQNIPHDRFTRLRMHMHVFGLNWVVFSIHNEVAPEGSRIISP